MQHFEGEDILSDLGKHINVEDISDVKVFVGKEKKSFLWAPFY